MGLASLTYINRNGKGCEKVGCKFCKFLAFLYLCGSFPSQKMFRILIVLFIGVVFGYVFRNVRHIKVVEKTEHYTVLVLLFVFGISIGSNHSLLRGIGYFGWQAVVIAVLGMIGSFGAGYLFNRFINKKDREDEK